MLEETIYFAGGLFPTGRYADNGQPVYDFGLAHHTGEDRPYLTKKRRRFAFGRPQLKSVRPLS